MKSEKIYLVVNNINKQNKPDANNVEGVFFSRQNAQWFAKQLMQENKICKYVQVYPFKKIVS